MKLGLEYVTHIPVGKAAQIIQEEAEALGYSVVLLENTDQAICIRMSRACSPFRFLVQRLPTEVTWRIRNSGSTTVVYCDSRLSGLSLFAALLTCGAFATLFSASAPVLLADWDESSVLVLSLSGLGSLVAFPLLFLSVSLVFSGGHERLGSILGSLRRESLRQGSFFAPTGNGQALRHTLRIVSLLVFTIPVLLIPVFPNLLHSRYDLGSAPGLVLFLGAIAAAAMVLCSCLVFVQHIPGFGARIIPCLSGGCTGIAALFMLLALFPWQLADGNIEWEDIDTFRLAQALHHDWDDARMPQWPDGTAIPREEIQGHYGKMRFVSCALWIGTFLCFGCAAFFFWMAVDVALRAYPYLHQMAQRPDCFWTRQATEGRGFRRLFSLTLALVWILLSICVVWSIGNLVTMTCRFLSRVTANGSVALSGIDASALFACIGLGISVDNGIAWVVVRALGGIYVCGCLVLFVLSAGSFAVQQLMASYRFRISALRVTPADPVLSRRCAELWAFISPSPAPEIVVFVDSFPRAQARCVGILHRRKLIEVTTGCLALLDGTETDALLSHELAHHARKHCQIDTCLRLLGRLTFFGDGFVRTIEDSFGAEMEADRAARDLFGVEPLSLKRCLWKMRTAAASQRLRQLLPGLPMDTVCHPDIDEVAVSKAGIKVRLRIGLSLLIEQYLGLGYSGYWHPSVDYRVTVLDGDQERVKTRETA